MEFKIEILSDDKDFAMKQAQSLKTWITNEDSIKEVTINQERAKLGTDDAGGILLSVLQIALGSSLLVELTKTIQVWVQERSKRLTSNSPEFKLSFSKPDGTKFEIDAKNIGEDQKAFIDKLTSELLAVDHKN